MRERLRLFWARAKDRLLRRKKTLVSQESTQASTKKVTSAEKTVTTEKVTTNTTTTSGGSGSDSHSQEEEKVKKADVANEKGRWEPEVWIEGEIRRSVWVNEEPAGGMVMEIKVGKKGRMVGPARQPEEAACFSHTPPDQPIDEYNARRKKRFYRDYQLNFARILARKVGTRGRDFERIHRDGLHIPQDAFLRQMNHAYKPVRSQETLKEELSSVFSTK